YVPPPDENGRKAVLKVLMRGLEYDEELLAEVVRKTTNFTPADLKAVVDEVRRSMMKEALEKGQIRIRVTIEDFEKVLQKFKPSVDPSTLAMYEAWRRNHQS
ncbi:MAG: ATP-binding protein, partial [Sulfolobales archaeon]|nr:ATP-binding protein [Sulfolobales archaeon]